MHEPQVLLLDEPASGMDPIARRDLRHILREVSAAGATVLISSHILSELSDMCTSFGIMHCGRLLRHGRVEAITESLQATTSELAIEFAAAAAEGARYLSSIEGVEAVSVTGQKVAVAFRGDAHARSRLLHGVLQQGFVLNGFSAGTTGIESALLQLIGEQPH